MRVVRIMLSFLLSVLLSLTGYNAAVARAAAPAVDQVVICVGTSAVVVHVDADGQPTHAPHLCPECTLHVLGTGTDVGPLPHPITFTALAHAMRSTPLVARAPLVSALARAPPA